MTIFTADKENASEKIFSSVASEEVSLYFPNNISRKELLSVELYSPPVNNEHSSSQKICTKKKNMDKRQGLS